MPTLDAVIPTFNAPPGRLHQAVASALSTPEIGRVIVVDDGSDPPVARAGPLMDIRVEVARQDNAGPSAARNLGLERSTADYLILLDDDDQLLPRGVSAMLALAERLGAAACVASRYERRAGSAMEHKPAPTEWAEGALPRGGDVFRPIAIFGASGMLIARRTISGGVRFDPTLTIGEDRDFLRKAAECGPIAVCGASALIVQLHETGLNLSSRARLDRRIADHLVLLGRHFEPADDAHWREATRWLLNAASKHGCSPESWRSLTAAMASRGWAVPWKSRLRRALARKGAR